MDPYLLLSDIFLLVMAITPIYIGSVYSVRYIKELAPETSHIKMDEAKIIPILLSAVVVTLYLLIKFFFKKYVDALVMTYFAVVSFYSIWESLCSAYKMLMSKNLSDSKGYCFNMSLNYVSGNKKSKIFELELTTVDIISAIISAALIGLYVATGNWILNNVIAECLTFTMITLLKLDSLKAALVLLGALLATDVFWVFGTDVMLTVARSLNVPIKLVVPQTALQELITGSIIPKSMWKYSFLGLGDIITPGIFISFCLVADLVFHEERVSKKKGTSKSSKVKLPFSFKKPYFHSSFFGYCFGLVLAFFFANTFKTGQPALLYLVPSTVLPVCGLAYIKGQLGEIYKLNTTTYYSSDEESTSKNGESGVSKRQSKKQPKGTDDTEPLIPSTSEYSSKTKQKLPQHADSDADSDILLPTRKKTKKQSTSR